MRFCRYPHCQLLATRDGWVMTNATGPMCSACDERQMTLTEGAA